MRTKFLIFLLWQHLNSVIKIISLLGNSVEIGSQVTISFDTLNSDIAEVGTIIRCSCLLAQICDSNIKKTFHIQGNMVFPLGGEAPDRQVFIFWHPYYSQNHLFFQGGTTTGSLFAQFLANLSLLCAVSPNNALHCWDTWFLHQLCVKEIQHNEDLYL